MEWANMNANLLVGEVYDDTSAQTRGHIFRNTDHFFVALYEYFTGKGLFHIILTEFCHNLSLGFTISFSIFLLGFVKWSQLFECHDEASCGSSIKNYLLSSPFSYHSGLVSFLLVIYIILFGVYWVYNIFISFQRILTAFDMEIYYREKLKINLDDIQIITWNEVIAKVIYAHQQHIHRIPGLNDNITVLDMVLRIMRKENYMIALINKELLNIRVPWFASSFISERLFLTKSLEWSLKFCILDFMYTDQLTISIDFIRNPLALEQRFYYLGILHLLLLPFMVIFMIINFFLSNVSQFRSTKAYLGPREWSPLALWTFREFNELPHVFDERILQSYKPANKYLALFFNSYMVVIARFVSYITGSFIAVLLLVSILSEGVLLYVHISEHNLLWFLGIFSAIFAGARSMIPPDGMNPISTATRNVVALNNSAISIHQEEPVGAAVTATLAEEYLLMTSSFTHYFPQHWIGQGHTQKVKEEFRELLPFKVQLFAMEILSVILTPLVLCCSLPENAKTIIAFIRLVIFLAMTMNIVNIDRSIESFRDHSKYVDGLGAICDYSLFDIKNYGNENYGAAINGIIAESDRPNDGKLEQSYMNFRKENPQWNGVQEGNAMEETLQYYRMAKEYDRANYEDTLRNSGIMTRLGMSINRPLGNMESSHHIRPNDNPYNATTSQEKQFNPDAQATDDKDEDEEIDSFAYNRTANTFALGRGQGDDFAPSKISRPSNQPFAQNFGYPFWNQTPQSNAYYEKLPVIDDSNEKILPSDQYPAATAEQPNAIHTTDNPMLQRNGLNENSNTGKHWSRNGYGDHRNQPPPTVNTTFASMSRRDMTSSMAMSGSSPIRNPIRHAEGNRINSANEIPAALRSILRNENIDYENDFYWMARFKRDRLTDPAGLEKSCFNSKMMFSGMTSFHPIRGISGSTDIFHDDTSLAMSSSMNQSVGMSLGQSQSQLGNHLFRSPFTFAEGNHGRNIPPYAGSVYSEVHPQRGDESHTKASDDNTTSV